MKKLIKYYTLKLAWDHNLPTKLVPVIHLAAVRHSHLQDIHQATVYPYYKNHH